MQKFELLRYHIYILEDSKDCTEVLLTVPNRINVFAFDTETNTKINMAKRDENLINIKHDKLFLLQFGFDDNVYVCDVREKSEACIQAFIDLYDTCISRAVLAVAHNIKFDINMLMNAGYTFHTNNLCDTKTIARLALESKSEREGGYALGLKQLSKRLLGSEYVEADKEIDEYLETLWKGKLKQLALALKPYGISRKQITDTLKDVTGVLDEYSIPVQNIWINWMASSLVSYEDIPKELIYRYGGIDVIMCLELTKLLLPVVKDKKQIPIMKREMRLVMPLVRMERTGYTVDKKYLVKCKQALIFEINAIKEKNAAIIGEYIEPNQNLAIKKALLDKYGYNLESTDKNAIHIISQTDTSMPKEVKEYLENVIYLRTLIKWISTYINPIIYKLNQSGDSKVYTQYDPSGAVSGRFTSNFQQFPKNGIYSKLGDFELFHPRKMFIVDKDCPEMAYIDYSQVELRLQAEYTYYCTKGYGDINMIRAYRPFKCHEVDGKWYHDEDNALWEGVDLHTQSTLSAFPDLDVHSPEFKTMRKIGKRVNFALIYGASLKKVQETLADCDPDIVAKLYNGFHARFKDVATYGRYVNQMWIQNGGYVTNLLGRRYYIDDPKDVYKLNNYLIQGSAADIIKMVIIRVDNMLIKEGYKTRLQGCIHDELCICVAEGEHDVIYKIKKIMESTVETYVPLVAEIEVTNTNWAEKHEEEEV
jgi:DNA polymerase-1